MDLSGEHDNDTLESVNFFNSLIAEQLAASRERHSCVELISYNKPSFLW